MPDPSTIKATTQQHLDIEDISDNLIVLKDGSAALIITTTAVNFGLLSESEQDATIYAYAALLNSLTFPVQILIRSKRKDISGYERLLNEREIKSPKPENKERIKKYREFIEETVRQRNVLDKKFYIIVPFSNLELGISKPTVSLAKTSKGEKNTLPFPKDYILSRAKMTLEPKRDHLLHQLARLGLRARQLTTKELIQLFFDIYNPISAQGQILASPEEYSTPIVQPDVAFQEAPQIQSPQEQKEQTVPSPDTKSGNQPLSPSFETKPAADENAAEQHSVQPPSSPTPNQIDPEIKLPEEKQSMQPKKNSNISETKTDPEPDNPINSAQSVIDSALNNNT